MGSPDGDETLQRLGGQEERILVSVRVRPLNEKEFSRNEVVDWECINDTTIIYKNHLSPERSMYPTSYTFDRVFRCDCSTRQVYEDGAKAVVLSAIRGVNSSVFAYGQTSSGKTFTMSGITEYTMEDIFDYILKHKDRVFQLKFSAMEIYNESVRDLLTADNSPLRLLDDPERGTVVEKLTEETLHDWNHFKELLALCEAQRQIGETFLNESSSRSHQILRLTIESSPREFLGKNNSGTLAATLNFVDLAGSERASQALSAGSRLKEGSHINRSLLTLGTVIRKLSKGRIGHIPFRDSKLTRILQPSLGGNARTAIICTMSPARSYDEQSRNTLLFASCAKEITTNARVNLVVSDKALVKHLQRELARLQTDLRSSTLSQQADTSDELREKDSKIEELERYVRQLTLQLDLALSKIHDLQQGVGDRSPTIWEGEDSSYPKLYVRQISESSTSNATTVTDHHSFISGSPAFGTPHSPDRHSRVSYDENYSISDVEENILPGSPFEQTFTLTPGDTSPPTCNQTPNVVGNYQCLVPKVVEKTTHFSEVDSCIVSTEIGEQSQNSNDIVSCQVSEEIASKTPETFEIRFQQVSDGHGSQYPYLVEFDPYHVLDEIVEQTPNSYDHDHYQINPETAENILHDDRTDPDHSPEATREQTDELVEDYCKAVQCIGSDNLQINSSPPMEEESLSFRGFDNETCNDDEPRQQASLSNTTSSSLQEAEEPSGNQQNSDAPECQNLSNVENISCQSVDTSCRSSISLEKMMNEMKTESGDGSDDFIVSLEETQMPFTIVHDVDHEVPHRSTDDMELDAISVKDIEASNHVDDAKKFTCDTEDRNNAAEPQSTNQLADYQLEDTMCKRSKSTKNMKDVGLNPQDDLDSSSSWLLDSKKLEREIINLWDTCNVSLVQRTYFFLLFINNKPADSIYMEVERRRLSLIKDAFSRGDSIVLDGWKLTPDTSKRSLHHEREKLGRLMKRRLPSQQTIDLYVKWGISLDTKRRSSQLAHRLWIDTEDIDHIVESANIVARLVRFSIPQAPKEVFGLNLMTKDQVPRKSSRWYCGIQSPSTLI